MQSLRNDIEKILPLVQKPARYIGEELNTIHKSFDETDIKIALAFPDVYELAMSHLGLQILYDVINKRKDSLAERVYAPWPDMEEQMRAARVPLFSLESFTAIKAFDFVGFTLQYELSYTNILNMLDLSGITIWQEARGEDEPFVIVGGPCVFNPEPLAPFVDFCVLGEAEEVIYEIFDLYQQWKNSGKRRQTFLHDVAKLTGVYVPSLYDVTYHADGTVEKVTPRVDDIPTRPQKRIIKDLDAVAYPTAPIVPYIDITHDRMVIEVFRGCMRGCRFCQAGFIYRPVREKTVDTLVKQVEEMAKRTGYDEVSLASLSSSDYSCIWPLLKELNKRLVPKGISISLPSLRIDAFGLDLAKEVQQVRKSGLTLAPEAGTQRLRDVINKQVSEDNLYDAVRDAVEAGWRRVKLYFMIGLPTETEEDLEGIVNLAKNVSKLGLKGPLQVTASTSGFVPKPHTPFQWVGQVPRETFKARQQYILGKIKRYRSVKYNYHNAEMSYLEAVFARGDRRLAQALYQAFRMGCKFDSWDEFFDFNCWQDVFKTTGLNADFYALRQRDIDETLPWDHIDIGVNKRYLQNEYKKALQQDTTPDCRWNQCVDCGVCPNLNSCLDLKGR